MFFIIGIFRDASGAGIIDVNGRDGDNKRRSSVDRCFQSGTLEQRTYGVCSIWRVGIDTNARRP
jgi:hypothetical protein